MPRTALFVLLVAAFVAAGCSDEPDEPMATATPPTVSMVSQNILHGITCPADSNKCELPDRVGLFLDQLQRGGCPAIVGLQETNADVTEAIDARLAETCDGRYHLVTDDDPGLDREVVLTTQKVIGFERRHLAGPLRTALLVKLATDVGLVDFITTHLASGSDDRPCDSATCPPPCQVSDRLNACHARQLVAFSEEVADPQSLVVIGGDLNAGPGDPTNVILTEAGFVDTHLAAGNAECDPQTGTNCTGGRADAELSGLEDPTSKQSERIDYLYVSGSRGCSAVAPTGTFNAAPETDGPKGLAFPSDHTAIVATLQCATTDAQREAATKATMPATSTVTTVVAGPADSSTQAAITEAFNALFGGQVTDVEAKIAALEGGDALRESLIARFESTKAIASRIVVRIDDIRINDATHASVTYSLLLDGIPVLDHLPGAAVKPADRWLVSKRTYCDVSNQGATEIPEPCR